ncbi:MAG: TIGR02281 family clan AA aspartic protease [Porticoccaceae bacterium]|jgi:aspartyl protease family protein|nr:TIGR02281 family clan AA aspartic protease [Porticoccaceae bacterium]HLS99100.1 TIGR02281 family clan AA aspartic protease [Porticoccaceae bacterium]
MKSVGIVLLAAFALLATLAWAAPDVVVKGLFANRAMLVIDGETRLLKVGQTSPEGVKLLASSSREAQVEIAGERRVLTLSRQISATYKAAEKAEVRIPRGPDSHYWVRGAINGKPVSMMVDTGATMLAMSGRDATRLGIDYRAGQRSRAQTAGGVVDSFVVRLDKVSIGAIVVHQVLATVVAGDFPQQILLGNSLLSRIEMREESGVLVLRQKI